MKMILAAPILVLIAGVVLLFAGSAFASAEEGIAASIGKFAQNKWIAVGLIVAGGLWFAHEEGYLTR